MTTRNLLTLAIIAAFPFGAMAENISGAMYTAPAGADTNHPAPTTQAAAPYGRANIDTADQEHIATTAYVKGAYNSAIAAVNKVDSEKQGKLINPVTGDNISTELFTASVFEDTAAEYAYSNYSIQELVNGLNGYKQATGVDAFNTLTTAGLTLIGMKIMAQRLNNDIEGKRVEIYTTWDDDTATQEVALLTAQ